MYCLITVFKYAGIKNQFLVAEGTKNICVSLISLYSDTRAFHSVSCSHGLPSKDSISFGYSVLGVQGVPPKRGKIRAVTFIPRPRIIHYVFLNCALTLLTDTYSILSEPGSLLCPTERQPLLALAVRASENSSMPISPPHGHHAFF